MIEKDDNIEVSPENNLGLILSQIYDIYSRTEGKEVEIFKNSIFYSINCSYSESSAALTLSIISPAIKEISTNETTKFQYDINYDGKYIIYTYRKMKLVTCPTESILTELISKVLESKTFKFNKSSLAEHSTSAFDLFNAPISKTNELLNILASTYRNFLPNTDSSS